MKQLKLEVGKTYRSRKGEEVKIIENDDTNRYPYRGDNDEWYTESGRFDYFIEDRKDLIEEVKELPETRHTFAIPDGVKEMTVLQEGNRIVVEMVPEKEPKPGDILVNKLGSVYIFKSDRNNGEHHSHFAWLGKSGRLSIAERCIESWCDPGRPATPEEAKPLFDALKKEGKRWNAETMQVEDVSEIERIREWVWANLKSDFYDKSQIEKAIEAYLKYREKSEKV